MFSETSVVIIVGTASVVEKEVVVGGAPSVDTIAVIGGTVVVVEISVVIIGGDVVVVVVVLEGKASVTLIRHPRLRWEAHCIHVCVCLERKRGLEWCLSAVFNWRLYALLYGIMYCCLMQHDIQFPFSVSLFSISHPHSPNLSSNYV